MDEDICRWVIEFTLRSPMNDRVIKKVLASIAVSDKDYRLRKMVLLRTIESEVSDAAVTETLLEIFEMIEELDKREGVKVMESMKDAYCAVAVECTVKYLLGSINRHGKYFDAVKRIWRGKVAEMEKLDNCELVSRELKGWKEEVEAALWDTNVSKKLMDMNTRNDALRLVGKYLGEAWGLLGPSFLQLSAALMLEKTSNGTQPVQSDCKSVIKECSEGVDKTTCVNEDMGRSCGTEMPCQTAKNSEPEKQDGQRDHCRGETSDNRDLSVNNGCRELAIVAVNNEEVQECVTETAKCSDVLGSDENRMTEKVCDEAILSDPSPRLGSAAKGEEKLKPRVLPRHKVIASHRRNRGGAKISNLKDMENDTLSGKRSRLLTPEVNRVQEALKTSSLDLQVVVKDPLPDALHVSDVVVYNLAKKNTNQGHSSEDRNDAGTVNPATNKDNEPLQYGNSSFDNPCGDDENIVPRPSLMERNGTACTHEWDDSIDNSPDRVGKNTSRLHLPSPKRKAVSPLKKYEETKIFRRRQMKRWSLLEEDTLRTAVEKFGKGNWKLILNGYRDIFEERTEVDLKDKWRNMTKH